METKTYTFVEIFDGRCCRTEGQHASYPEQHH